ncbi:MAG: hypothetical protein DIU61_015360 [Bacteroidota bacterium]|jgi:hypothetical protein|nr:MAG: hypothetical protein DIU61_17335 [Bacteroidota bacterium]
MDAVSQDSFTVCEHCNSINGPMNKYCSQCSFPIRGSEGEKASFLLTVSSRRRFLDDARQKIKSARTVIFVLAALFFVFGLFVGFAMDDFPSMIVSLVLCLIYLLLAAWCNQNPFGAILTAFIIYVTLIMVNMLVDPETLFQGIIIKIGIIAWLVKGIRSAHEAKGYLRELQNLRAVPVDAE